MNDEPESIDPEIGLRRPGENGEYSKREKAAPMSRLSKRQAVEEEYLALAAVLDIAENDPEALPDYLVHIRINLAAANGCIKTAVLNRYRLPGGRYDIDLAAMDLRTYPPIADRITQHVLQEQARAEQKRQSKRRRREAAKR